MEVKYQENHYLCILKLHSLSLTTRWLRNIILAAFNIDDIKTTNVLPKPFLMSGYELQAINLVYLLLIYNVIVFPSDLHYILISHNI